MANAQNIKPIVLSEHMLTLPHQLHEATNMKNILEPQIELINDFIEIGYDMKQSPFDPNDNSGLWLDQCGSNWNVSRGIDQTDASYRIDISNAIVTVISSGNIKQVVDLMKNTFCPTDDTQLLIHELNELTDIGYAGEYGAYYLVEIQQPLYTRYDAVVGTLNKVKSAGVGVVAKLTQYPLLGDDGIFYDIFRRKDYFGDDSRDSHIVKPSTKTKTIRIIIPPHDGIGSNKEVKISVDGTIYTQDSNEVEINNEFIFSPFRKIVMYSYDDGHILWNEENVSKPILGDDGICYEIFSRQNYRTYSDRNSHVVTTSSQLDPISIIIPPYDGIGLNKEIRVNTNLKIYTKDTIESIKNNEYQVSPDKKISMYSYRNGKIAWVEEDV